MAAQGELGPLDCQRESWESPYGSHPRGSRISTLRQRQTSVPESRGNRCEHRRMGKRKAAERQREVKGSHQGCPATEKGALDLGTSPSSVLLLPHSPPRRLPFLPLPHPRLTSSSSILRVAVTGMSPDQTVSSQDPLLFGLHQFPTVLCLYKSPSFVL